MSEKKGMFKPFEDEIVKKRWKFSTDKEIAADIGRTERAVALRRKKLGLKKPNGRPADSRVQEAITSNPTEFNLSKLSKEDRTGFYRTQFSKNIRFPQLQQTLLRDEMDYYQSKYIETIESMDTCTHQEEDLVHHMIMKEIQILRLQREIKDALEAKREGEDEKGPSLYLYQELTKAEQQYVTYKEKLTLTREQRLKKGEESKLNIVTIVRAYQEEKNRKNAGRMAGEMAYFTAACKDDMTKMDFLMGG